MAASVSVLRYHLHSVRDGVIDVALALLANGLIEKNVRLSDNLVIEFGEQKSPLAGRGCSTARLDRVQ